MDKSLLSAEMVTGGVYMAHCYILAVGDTVVAATVSLQETGSLATGH